jgi:excisionase family DNA binding protein
MSDQPKIEAPGALLTQKAAAERLCISERLLWKLTAKGAIPAVRLGRSVRYCPGALARIIEKGGAK